MTRALAFVSLLALAACGVDGEPIPPEPLTPPQSRTAVTGGVGIGIGDSGTHVRGGIGLHRDNVSVRIGF